MQQIFALNMPMIEEKDMFTGLPLFMLAAIGPASGVESVYNSLKVYLSTISYPNEPLIL